MPSGPSDLLFFIFLIETLISSVVMGPVSTVMFSSTALRPDALLASSNFDVGVILSLSGSIAHCLCSKWSASISGLSFDAHTVVFSALREMGQSSIWLS